VHWCAHHHGVSTLDEPGSLCAQTSPATPDPLPGTIAVFRFDDKRDRWSPIRKWQAHQQSITDMKFLSDDVLITASADRSIKEWRVSTGLYRYIFSLHFIFMNVFLTCLFANKNCWLSFL
jgi:WD40 repeat protein